MSGAYSVDYSVMEKKNLTLNFNAKTKSSPLTSLN